MDDPFAMVKFLLRAKAPLEASREMRNLPKRFRNSVAGNILWLKIFTEFNSFEICELIASALLDDLVPSDEALESIARFRLAQARSKIGDADMEGAKQSLRDALARWPPIQEVINSSPELSTIMGG